MKKLSIWILVFSMMMSLAGCGGQTESEAQTAKEQQSITTKAEDPPSEAAAAESAEESARHQPYPNTKTGTWWVWDAEANAYKDTGVLYGASTFVYQQGVASDTWTIPHNLGKYPSVTVVDSTGRVVVGGTQYLDSNTVVLTFSGAFSGVAYLN